MGVVLPAKRDAVIGDVDEPMIGNGHAVRVPREAVQHVLGSSEGRFGVHDPVLAKQRAEERAKCLVVRERLELAGKHQSAATKRVLQSRDKLSAKHATQDRDGEEERIPRMDPPRSIRREPPDGNHAVDMRMV